VVKKRKNYLDGVAPDRRERTASTEETHKITVRGKKPERLKGPTKRSEDGGGRVTAAHGTKPEREWDEVA